MITSSCFVRAHIAAGLSSTTSVDLVPPPPPAPPPPQSPAAVHPPPTPQVFLTEHYLDNHLDAQHAHDGTLLPTESSTCLADYHDLLHAPRFEAWREGEAGWASDPLPCSKGLAATRQKQCKALAARCFPWAEGKAAQLLLEHFTQLCKAHTCDSRRKRRLLQAVAEVGGCLTCGVGATHSAACPSVVGWTCKSDLPRWNVSCSAACLLLPHCVTLIRLLLILQGAERKPGGSNAILIMISVVVAGLCVLLWITVKNIPVDHKIHAI